jgi:hypothetical protein
MRHPQQQLHPDATLGHSSARRRRKRAAHGPVANFPKAMSLPVFTCMRFPKPNLRHLLLAEAPGLLSLVEFFEAHVPDLL